ncbi:MAG: hypothetical protein V4543_12255 [Bacteroidota bacterium]
MLLSFRGFSAALLIAVSAFVLTSCGEDDDDSPTPQNATCTLTKMKSFWQESDFDYDATGRMVRLTKIDTIGSDVSVTLTEISYSADNATVYAKKSYFARENGADTPEYPYAEFDTAKLQSGRVVWERDFKKRKLTFSYDADGHLLKALRATGEADFEYTWQGGNLVKSVMPDVTPAYVTTLTISYFDSLTNPVYAYNYYGTNNLGLPAHFYGTQSKNLPKKAVSRTGDQAEKVFTSTYMRNSNGAPTTANVAYPLSGTSVNYPIYFAYNCR